MNAPAAPTPVASAVRSNVYAVRASSWGSLFDCAMRWEGQHLLGIQKAAGLRAQLGTAIHASTAAFDASRLPGAAPVSVDDAAEAFVQTLHNPDREVDYRQDDLTVRDAERIGLTLHSRYCHELSPTMQFLSVEQKLKPLDIDCGGGMVVRLTGTMDRARVVQATAGIVIPDVKTGAGVIENGAAKTQGRAAQIGTYQLMYEATEGVATAGGQVLALQTSGKPQVMASKVFDARRVMVGTMAAPGLIEHAAAMFKTGMFPPNPQSMLCSERYCSRWATCPFHD